MGNRKSYLPAAGYDWLLWTYDPWLKLLGADKVRSSLIEQMALAPGQLVLDIGCGTGNLAVLLKQLHPSVSVIGLDPDPAALARAAHKAKRAVVKLDFVRGFSDQLPYSDSSFDRVLSTFMLGLLSPAEKQVVIREVRRVLRLDGSFHLLDLIKQPSGSSLMRLLRSNPRSHLYTDEQNSALMYEAGLHGVRKTGEYAMWLWPVASYRASRS